MDNKTETAANKGGKETFDSSDAESTAFLPINDDSKYSFWSIYANSSDSELDTGPLVTDFYCNYCNKSLPLGSCRIRCAECSDYDLCIRCACNFMHTETHELSHKYIPIGPNNFELFSEGWTADEELLLLEGISKFGFGNWKQVAEMVNTVSAKQKSPYDCESHYNDAYISSVTSPYPDIKKIRSKLSPENSEQKLFESFNVMVKSYKRFENPDADDRIISSEASGSHSSYIPPPVDILHSNPNQVKFFQNFTGYNIYRDELENEYNNDAEMILKDVEFEPWDSPSEIKFKVQLIDLYNGLLDERIYRKRVLIHRFWYDFQLRDKEMANMTDVEKMVYWRVSPLLRFHSEDDHMKLTKLLIAKAELEKRLEIVQQWTSLGFKTIQDIQDFDIHKPTKQNNKHRIPMDKVDDFAAKLIGNSRISKQDLYAHIGEMHTRFCDEFSISESQLHEMFNYMLETKMGNGTFPTNSNAVIPAWDLCFDNSLTEAQRNSIPKIANAPKLIDGPDYSKLRIILKGNKNGYDLSDLNFDQIQLNTEPKTVRQSRIQVSKDSYYYFTELPTLSQLDKIKVSKTSNKRKKDGSYNFSNKLRASQRR
ncbi:hypothetical protein BEWA_033470 [Theileria equi strain WA]|uniref:Uncharacterized protein n=1 Tax=Theileria equi strain WA TaxID=1537102 RepID=L0B044_THEEQ|nr:hypothetical protein BEWA_033470 [Theileria equi strain WA]AFZ80494.1 hypothetical protein BEWA_033470 [Theileria equi strain WA]|eukprot:XP_004830160.1 hypothetical protein BEWA_033470 [Theileria equi strain WA]